MILRMLNWLGVGVFVIVTYADSATKGQEEILKMHNNFIVILK